MPHRVWWLSSRPFSYVEQGRVDAAYDTPGSLRLRLAANTMLSATSGMGVALALVLGSLPYLYRAFCTYKGCWEEEAGQCIFQSGVVGRSSGVCQSTELRQM